MSAKTTPSASPVEVARRELETQREKLAHWEAQQAATQTELGSLQERAGDEVLDDPAAAGNLARSMQGLRDRLDIAERAVVAQRPRVAQAESTYLSAEADVLELEAAAARAALDAHQARTAKLLAELEKHEGKFVPEVQLIDAMHMASIVGAPISWDVPKSGALEDAVAVAELRVTVLRDLAAGRDPAPELQARASIQDGRVAGVAIPDVYPACVWGPDAVVKAPAYAGNSVQAGQS